MHESKKQQIAELSRDGIGNGISPLTSRARGHQLCFLDLPREIRDEIYAYYLFPDGDRDPIIIPHICGYSLSRSGLLCCREDVWVDLLTVCKSISEEARLYLYSHCDFRSHWELNLDILYVFLLIIGRENRSFIRKLEINITCVDLKNALKMSDVFLTAEHLKDHRGPCFGHIIELLSKGHNLEELSIRFKDEKQLAAFFRQKTLVEAFAPLRSVGLLLFEVEGKNGEEYIREQGLWDVFHKTVETVQSRPSRVQESPRDALPVVRQTREHANKLLALVNDHRVNVEGQIAAEKEAQEHEKKANLAGQRATALESKITAIKKDIERYAGVATD